MPIRYVFAVVFLVLVKIQMVGAQETFEDGLDVSGQVRAIYRDSNTIYVGGAFSSVAHIANRVARFSAGSTIPDIKFPQTNGVVNSIISDGAGGYFVGGSFSTVGLRPRTNIFRVLANGSLDPTFAPTLSNPVNALLLSGSTLYIGGSFTTVNGISRARLASVNSTNGSLIGSFTPQIEDGTVTSLALAYGRIYAGGSFTRVSGRSQLSLASFDMLSGEFSDGPSLDGQVDALHLRDTELLVGGRFSVGGLSSSKLAIFSGGSSVPDRTVPLFNSAVNAIVPDGSGGFYMAGDFLTVGTRSRTRFVRLRADRSIDTVWVPEANGTVRAMERRGDTIFIGGDFTSINGVGRNRLAAISASTGLVIPFFNPSPNGSIRALRLVGNRLFAAGDFTSIALRNQRSLAAFNATTGEIEGPTISAEGRVNSLHIRDSVLYIGGAYSRIGNASQNLAKVTTTNSLRDSLFPTVNGVVLAIVPDGTGGWYIGGSFSTVGSAARQNVARILSNGSIDATFVCTVTGGSVQALCLSGSTLFVGGTFSTVNGTSRAGLASVQSSTGALNAGFVANCNAGVNALDFQNNTLYVGGGFTTINNLNVRFSAALNPSTGNPQHFPSANGTVNAVRSPDSLVYLGGTFTGSGYVSPGIARFQANSPVPDSAFPRLVLNGTANAVISDGAGGYYVGGAFSSINGVSRTNLARINPDNSVDPVFVCNVTGTSVQSLKLAGTVLYVGGTFSQIGGQSRGNFAAVNPSSGAVLPLTANTNNAVLSVETSGSAVLLGGQFTQVSGQSVGYLASIDNTSGAINAFPEANNTVNQVVIRGDTIHAVGAMTTTGYSRDRIVRYPLGSETPGARFAAIAGTSVNAVVQDASGNYYVGGSFSAVGGVARSNLARLFPDGTLDAAWNVSVTGGQIESMVLSGTTLYICGAFTTIGGTARSFVGAINTATQSLITAFAPALNLSALDLALRGDTVIVGGNFTTVGGRQQPNLAYFRASDGALLNSPATQGVVNDIEIGSDGHMYLGGNFTQTYYTTGGLALVDTNTAIPNQLSPFTDNEIYSVISDGAGGWYVGGTFTSIGGVSRNRLARISATGAVDATFNPNVNGAVNVLVLDGGNLYLGGDFTSVGGQTRNRIARVDAGTGAVSTWNPNLNEECYAIAKHQDSLYIGGRFTTVGGTARNYLAKISGSTAGLSTWNPNAQSFVRSLVLDQNLLYVGGDFTQVSGTARNRAAAYDTTTRALTAFNPNTNGSVYAVAVAGTNVILGGSFSTVGGIARNRLASVVAATSALNAFNPNAGNLVRALAVTGNKLYAVGDFTTMSSQARGYGAAFDLSTETLTQWSPDASGQLFSVLPSGGTVVLGGGHDNIKENVRARASRINLASGAITAWNPSPNSSVNKIIYTQGRVFLAGNFSLIAGVSRSFFAETDTAAGTATSLSIPFGAAVNDLAVASGTLYIGGNFVASASVPSNRLLGISLATNQFNWRTGANSAVQHLAVLGPDLVASGTFAYSPASTSQYYGGIVVTSRALSSANIQANNTINAIAFDGNSTYLGGLFTQINGISRSRLCEVNTNTGQVATFSPTFDANINGLTVIGSNLHVGGAFTLVNGLSRNRQATFSLPTQALQSALYGYDGTVSGFVPATGGFVAYGAFNYSMFSSGSSLYVVNGTTLQPAIANPVVSGSVSAIHVATSTYYVGGQAMVINGVSRLGIAELSRSTGDLTAFAPSVSGGVVSSIQSNVSTLYVGGSFTTVNSSPLSGLVGLNRSDGTVTSWSPSPSGSVSAVGLSGTDVLIGGSFAFINSGPRANLSGLGANDLLFTTFGPSANDEVYDIETSPQGLYVAGEFTTINSTSRRGLAVVRTPGGELGSQTFDLIGGARNLALSGTQVFVGGSFTGALGQARGFAAAFDTLGPVLTSWVPQMNALVSTVTASGSDIVLSGDFTLANSVTRRGLAQLNGSGSTFTSRNAGLNGNVNSIVSADTLVYIGGTFTTLGATTRNRVAAIGANSFLPTLFNPNVGNDVFSLALRADTLVVVGSFSSPRSRFAVYDRVNGTLLPWSLSPAGTSINVAVLDGNGLTLGGDFTRFNATTRNNAFAYNTLTREILSWHPNIDGPVFAIGGDANNIYLGGSYTVVGGQNRTCLAQVDKVTAAPSSWTANISGLDREIRSIVRTGTRLFVGGSFTSINALSRTRIAELSTSSGTPTGFNPSPNGTIEVLALDGDTLYFGGTFSTLNGPINRSGAASVNIATSVVTSWNPNVQAGQTVRSIAVTPNSVWLGGFFTAVGGVSRQNLCEVTKSTAAINPFSSTFDNGINALAVRGKRIFVGGTFQNVGGRRGLGFATFMDSAGAVGSYWSRVNSTSTLALAFDNRRVHLGGTNILHVDSVYSVQNYAAFNLCNASVVLSGPTTACPSDSVTLQVSVTNAASGLTYQWRNLTTNQVVGTSATLKVATASTTTFQVSVSDDNGCSYLDQQTVAALAGPQNFSVSSNQDNTCVGDTVTVTTSGSQTGTNYQLVQNGIPVGSLVAGTGSALVLTRIGIAAGRSVFTVRATLVSSGCGRQIGDSVVVTKTPIVLSFTPLTGSAGSVITVSGRSFTGATAVSFGGVAAQSFTVLNDSVISATVGSGAAGKVRVTVGSCFGESATDFTIDATDITVRAYMQNLYSGGVHQVVPAMVELWSGSDLSSATLAHRAAGTVNTAGEVKVSIQGLVTGQYWIVYRYAGHLAVSSSARVTITAGTPLTYDFTDAASKALGFESTVNIGGAFHLRGGDPDGNADINGTDYGSVTTNFGQSTSVPAATLGSAGTGSPVTAVTVTSYMQNYFSGGVHRVSSVMIELRSGVDLDASTLVGQQSVVLGTNGQATASFAGLASGQYWLVIRHGAHLAVASANRLSVTAGTPVSYNFSDAANRAFGFQTTVLSGGVYLIRCGDSNGDGDISGTDYSPVTTNFGRSAVVPEP